MNKKGFTLVELMVSFSLIAIISIFLFQIVMIINSIYNEKGIKTELILEQSSISNTINKDIFSNNNQYNTVKKIARIDDNQVDIVFNNGSTKSIKIDRDNLTISYGDYVQKFLNNTIIGSIIVDFDYISSSDLSLNGVASIRIPISYNGLDTSFDVFSLIRFNSNEMVING